MKLIINTFNCGFLFLYSLISEMTGSYTVPDFKCPQNCIFMSSSVHSISQSFKVLNGRCQSDDDCMMGESVIAGHGEYHS